MTSLLGFRQSHVSNGVPFRLIGELAQCSAGATPSSGVAEYWESGTIPWMSSGEVNKGTIFDTEKKITQAAFDSCSTKMLPANVVVMALAGQGKTRGTVARTRIPLCTNQSLATMVPDPSVLDSDFLYYYLTTQYSRLREVSSGDGTRGGLNLKTIRSYAIPVPSLEVQREIVRVLDHFSEQNAALDTALGAELEARGVQYEHHRRSILLQGKSAPQTLLRDVVDFRNAKAHERLVSPEGTVALMTARFISRGEANRFVHPEDVLSPAFAGDVAMVMSDLPNGRALARTFYVAEDGKYAANQRVCLLRPRDHRVLNPRYLAHVLNRHEQLLAYDTGVDQTHLKKDYILDVQFSLPTAEVQEAIVNALETFDANFNELRFGIPAELAARRTQYEYYRDKLLTFEEAPA